MENEIILQDGSVDWNAFRDVLVASSAWNDGTYASVIDRLIAADKLSRHSGYRLYASGILTINPREGGEFGKQLYFTDHEDAKEYGRVLYGDSPMQLEIAEISGGKRVTRQ